MLIKMLAVPHLIQYENVLLPEVSQFQSFQHPAPHHNRSVYPPDAIYSPPAENENTSSPFPLKLFQLFFTEAEFEILAQNTNLYAKQKGVGKLGSRPGRPTCAAECYNWALVLVILAAGNLSMI